MKPDLGRLLRWLVHDVAKKAMRSNFKNLVALLFASCVCTISLPVFAQSCRTVEGGNYNVSVGSQAIPRDAAVGSVVIPRTPYLPRYHEVCDASNDHNALFFFTVDSAPVPGFTDVYPTNIAGLGIRYLVANGCDYNTPVTAITSLGFQMTCEIVDIGPDTVGSLITTITEFIKTGPISPGTLTTVPRVKVEYAFTDRPARSEITPFFSGSATGTISTNACATPNITVDMGSHKSTEMSGIGTSTSSTNFNIALNNCPADITAIKYQIDAVTSVLDAANAVVALDGSSSAKGVGVQLLNNAGNVQTLGAENTLAGVNGASSYTIPLRARYRQTEGSVRGGTANTSMTFSILYP